MDVIKSVKYNKLVIWILVFLSTFWVLFSYIQAEINSFFYLKDITNVTDLCQAKLNSDFKFAKLITYYKNKNLATIYCIYDDPAKNLELNLNYKNDIWSSYYSKKLNREGNVYWPIYV